MVYHDLLWSITIFPLKIVLRTANANMIYPVPQEDLRELSNPLSYNVVPPFVIAKLVNITTITTWFMVLIPVVTRVCKAEYYFFGPTLYDC